MLLKNCLLLYIDDNLLLQYLMLQVVMNTRNINRTNKATQIKLYSICYQKYSQNIHKSYPFNSKLHLAPNPSQPIK